MNLKRIFVEVGMLIAAGAIAGQFIVPPPKHVVGKPPGLAFDAYMDAIHHLVGHGMGNPAGRTFVRAEIRVFSPIDHSQRRSLACGWLSVDGKWVLLPDGVEYPVTRVTAPANLDAWLIGNLSVNAQCPNDFKGRIPLPVSNPQGITYATPGLLALAGRLEIAQPLFLGLQRSIENPSMVNVLTRTIMGHLNDEAEYYRLRRNPSTDDLWQSVYFAYQLKDAFRTSLQFHLVDAMDALYWHQQYMQTTSQWIVATEKELSQRWPKPLVFLGTSVIRDWDKISGEVAAPGFEQIQEDTRVPGLQSRPPEIKQPAPNPRPNHRAGAR